VSAKGQDEEYVEWFGAGIVAAVLSIIPIPTVPDSTIAGFVLGIFLGIIFPVIDIAQEAEDLSTRKWGWACGLAYAAGLLLGCWSLISSGTPIWDLGWPILEDAICWLASIYALSRRLIALMTR